MEPPARAVLNIRIDRDLKGQLHELAFTQNRTLSNLVETELRRVVFVANRAPARYPAILPEELDDGK